MRAHGYAAGGVRACVQVRTESESWLRFLPAFEIAGRAGLARRAPGLADAFGFSAQVSSISPAACALPFSPPFPSAMATILSLTHRLFGVYGPSLP